MSVIDADTYEQLVRRLELFVVDARSVGLEEPSVDNGFIRRLPWTPPDVGLTPPWYRPGPNVCEACWLYGNYIRSNDLNHDVLCEINHTEERD